VTVLTYSLTLRSPGSLGLHYGRPLFLSTVFCRHLLTFISRRSLSTSSSHLYLGLPLLLFPSGLLSKIFLNLLPWSILNTWLYNICHCEDAHENLILCICIYIYTHTPSLVLRSGLIPEEVDINKNNVPIRNEGLAESNSVSQRAMIRKRESAN